MRLRRPSIVLGGGISAKCRRTRENGASEGGGVPWKLELHAVDVSNHRQLDCARKELASLPARPAVAHNICLIDGAALFPAQQRQRRHVCAAHDIGVLLHGLQWSFSPRFSVGPWYCTPSGRAMTPDYPVLGFALLLFCSIVGSLFLLLLLLPLQTTNILHY